VTSVGSAFPILETSRVLPSLPMRFGELSTVESSLRIRFALNFKRFEVHHLSSESRSVTAPQCTPLGVYHISNTSEYDESDKQ
jgi:hypothetical protein